MRLSGLSMAGGTRLWSVLAGIAAVQAAAPALAQWAQWGGPNRDFTCEATGLADEWPESGPREVWSREIGGGHSSILVDDGRIYTMCRRDEQDAVLAMQADNGETIWETRYDAPTKPDMALDFGPGPHSTPLIVGDRIFTVGGMAQFHCLDKQTGKILWSHDLMEEFGASDLMRGYGSSPIAYGDLVILSVGPRRATESSVGLAAFEQDTGEVAWKSEPFGGGYASPILVKLNGEDQLIVALGADRVGLDPATGKTRWRTTVDFQSFGIMATPMWIAPDRLFCSAGYGGGTRVFRIKAGDDGYAPEELWHYRKMQVVHGVAARVGEIVYGSSHGSFGPAFLMAIDLATGKPLWRQRGLAKANVLYADGKFFILDEEGVLALATVKDDGFDIRSKATVLQRLAWTCPTLVGTRMYLRDNKTIKCLDLGATANQVATGGTRGSVSAD